MEIVAVKEVRRVKDGTREKSKKRQDASSTRRSSIYEQLLSQQVLKPKQIKTNMKRGSDASLMLNVNQSSIRRHNELSETKSPGVAHLIGDLSLENKGKPKQKAARTCRK